MSQIDETSFRSELDDFFTKIIDPAYYRYADHSDLFTPKIYSTEDLIEFGKPHQVEYKTPQIISELSGSIFIKIIPEDWKVPVIDYFIEISKRSEIRNCTIEKNIYEKYKKQLFNLLSLNIDQLNNNFKPQFTSDLLAFPSISLFQEIFIRKFFSDYIISCRGDSSLYLKELERKIQENKQINEFDTYLERINSLISYYDSAKSAILRRNYALIFEKAIEYAVLLNKMGEKLINNEILKDLFSGYYYPESIFNLCNEEIINNIHDLESKYNDFQIKDITISLCLHSILRNVVISVFEKHLSLNNDQIINLFALILTDLFLIKSNTIIQKIHENDFNEELAITIWNESPLSVLLAILLIVGFYPFRIFWNNGVTDSDAFSSILINKVLLDKNNICYSSTSSDLNPILQQTSPLRESTIKYIEYFFQRGFFNLIGKDRYEKINIKWCSKDLPKRYKLEEITKCLNEINSISIADKEIIGDYIAYEPRKIKKYNNVVEHLDRIFQERLLDEHYLVFGPSSQGKSFLFEQYCDNRTDVELIELDFNKESAIDFERKISDIYNADKPSLVCISEIDTKNENSMNIIFNFLNKLNKDNTSKQRKKKNPMVFLLIGNKSIDGTFEGFIKFLEEIYPPSSSVKLQPDLKNRVRNELKIDEITIEDCLTIVLRHIKHTFKSIKQVQRSFLAFLLFDRFVEEENTFNSRVLLSQLKSIIGDDTTITGVEFNRYIGNFGEDSDQYRSKVFDYLSENSKLSEYISIV